MFMGENKKEWNGKNLWNEKSALIFLFIYLLGASRATAATAAAAAVVPSKLSSCYILRVHDHKWII